jgi:hypothetical protein
MIIEIVMIFPFVENLFLRKLKLNLNDGDIIIMASYDEMTYAYEKRRNLLFVLFSSCLD